MQAQMIIFIIVMVLYFFSILSLLLLSKTLKHKIQEFDALKIRIETYIEENQIMAEIGLW